MDAGQVSREQLAGLWSQVDGEARSLLQLRFGFPSGACHTISQAATQLGLPRETVVEWERQLLRMLPGS